MGVNLRIPLPERSAEIIVVLIEPEIQGNVGAVARSMRNFGFDELRIIAEDGYEFEDEALARSKHAKSVLLNCEVFSDWHSCMDDISIVIGSSGKRELGEKVAFRHFVMPEELGGRVLDISGKIAIVFGREGVGILTEELQMCDILVTIPTWEGYPILNLSHAVTIILYELHKSLIEVELGKQKGLPKTTQGNRILDPELRRMVHTLSEELAQVVNVQEHKRPGISDTLKRVIMRGMPLDDEAHRILGVMKQSRDALREKHFEDE
ncbi:MAG: RNA methyltransferase [Euryarchaeota archaeon]|jgi:TrmH family RNA methyltransferase|nr:RNA methyltransferase [Euryarchaeota archaeon]